MKTKSLKNILIPVFLAPMLMLSGSGEASGGRFKQANSIMPINDTSATNFELSYLRNDLYSIALGDLSQEEIDGLIYMREEEKLAHDVYTVLYGKWSQRVFNNITNSEKTHTDAILELINRYGLTDPVGDNGIGEFNNASLKNLYDTLVATGSSSLIDALLVGAAIEEIDMIDINNHIDHVVGNDDIILVYENLLKGSRNHLRAFVNNLNRLGVTYVPQYMDPTEYQEIINSSNENGGNGNSKNGNGRNGNGRNGNGKRNW
jgi:hypothetical protein